MAEKKKWMQNINIKKGALHKALKVPVGQNIPASKLKSKGSDTPLMAKRKALARTFKKSKH